MRPTTMIAAAGLLAAGCTDETFDPPTFTLLGAGIEDNEIWYLPGYQGGAELYLDRDSPDTDVPAWTYLVWGKIHVGEVDLDTRRDIPLFADDETGDGEIALHDGPGHFLGIIPTHVVYPDGGSVTTSVNFTGELIRLEPFDTLQVLAGDIARVSVEYTIGDVFLGGGGLLVTDDAATTTLHGTERDSVEIQGRNDLYRLTLGAGPTWRQAIDVRGVRNTDVVATILPGEEGQAPGAFISLHLSVRDAQGDPVLYRSVRVGENKGDWGSTGYQYDPTVPPRTVTMITGVPGNLVRATAVIHPQEPGF